MKRIGLAAWHGHAILSESVRLLLSKHVPHLLLAWSYWVSRAGALASEGHAGGLLLEASRMLSALAFATRVFDFGAWSSRLGHAIPWLPCCASVDGRALGVLVHVLWLAQ